MTSLSDLEMHYPDIRWREPVKIATTVRPILDVVFAAHRGIDLTATTIPEVWRYACRICIANRGIRDGDIAALPTDPYIVREHIRKEHGP